MEKTADGDAVRAEVRELLARSASFHKLPVDLQREIARSTVAVAEAVAGDPALHPADFPVFVRDLIHGTFEAIVDASVQQMEAYGELLKAVAGTADEFASGNVKDEAAFEYLSDHTIDPDSDRWPDSVRCLLLPAARAQIAESRQKLLATMVLMGINRIMEQSCDD